MSKIFQELNERCRNHSTRNFEYKDDCIADTEENDMSFQFFRMQTNQLTDSKQNLERYVNTLPVFGFNSGRYDLNLIKSYLIPYLINDKEAEPMVIKKANNFITCKFGDWANNFITCTVGIDASQIYPYSLYANRIVHKMGF